MRYTRLEIPKNSNSTTYRLIFEFFIIIPIIATIFGGLLTKILIVPYFDRTISSDNHSGNLISKPVIVGKEYRISILQAGVFSNKNNAEILVKGLISKGVDAFYIQDQDSFRIIIDVSEDRDALQEKQTNLAASGYNCIIHDYNIYIKNQDGNNNKFIDSYRYEIAKLIKLETQYSQALSQKKEFNLEQIKSNIGLIEAEYNKVKESETTINKADEISKYHTEIIKLGNEIISNNDLKEILTRLTNQVILIDKLSNTITN